MSLSQELETYYNNFEALFRNEGFKQLCEELDQNARQLADIQTVKDNDDLFFRKGQVAAFASILNLPETMKLAREQAEAEAEEPVDV